MFVQLVVAVVLCSSVVQGFAPAGLRPSARFGSALRMSADTDLEAKLKAKSLEQTLGKKVEKKVAEKKVTEKKVAEKKVAEKKVEKKVAAPSKAIAPAAQPKKLVKEPKLEVFKEIELKPKPEKQAPVAVAKKQQQTQKGVVSVAPAAPESALSSGDALAGVGLGVAPYLLLPAVFLNGLLKKAKPLPVPAEKVSGGDGVRYEDGLPILLTLFPHTSFHPVADQGERVRRPHPGRRQTRHRRAPLR